MAMFTSQTLGQRRDRGVGENGEVTLPKRSEAQHPPSLLFWGHIHHPSLPALGDLLCQLLEADGSPLCGGPVGAFPDMGVPRVRLGREDHGHHSEGAWFPLGDAQEPWGLMAVWPRPTLSPRRE